MRNGNESQTAPLKKRKYGWRHLLRERAWATLSIVVGVSTLINTSGLAALAPKAANATAASIWTTQETCLTPADQDANEYANGDHVYVRGKNFNPDADYFGQIHGQPGGASEDPGELVASFNAHTDEEGYFCADAYIVGTDDGIDDGVYTVDVWDNPDYEGGSKNDNYHVTGLSDITVNKWLLTEGGWVQDNDAANALGFKWGIGDVNVSTNREFGTQATDFALDDWFIRENTVSGYHTVGYFVGEGSCTEPMGTEPGFLLDVTNANYTVNFCNAPDEPTTGTLVVHKQADTDGDGIFDLTVMDNEGGFAWQLDDASEWNTFGTSMELPGGGYDVREKDVTGYHMVGWTYGSPDGDICGGDRKISGPTDLVNVEVEVGEETHITFCNAVDEFTIQVNKIVEPWDSESYMLASDTEWTWSTGSITKHSQESVELGVGTHTFTETPDLYPASGWNASWTCYKDVESDEDPTYGTGSGRSFSTSDWGAQPENGDSFYCNFVNSEKEPEPVPGTLTVTKYFYDNGWSGEPSRTNPEGWTWDLVGGAQDIAGGKSVEVAAGSYTATEDAITNYTSSWYCYRDLGEGGVYLGGGNGTSLNVQVGEEENIQCYFQNVALPNITISKTDNHITAQPGETLTYEVTVTNSTGAPAFGVQVVDTLPNFLSNPTDISDSGFFAAGKVTWPLLNIAGNSSKTLTFKATVNGTMPFGTTILHNEAVLGCSILDIRLSSVQLDEQCRYAGTAIDETSVTTTVSIGLDKTGPATAVKGQTFTYNLAWSVTGNAAVTNAIITDPLPANTTFVSATNGGTFAAGVVTWNLGAQNPGANGVVSVTVTVNPELTASTTLNNTGTFDTDQTQPVSDSVPTTVTVPQVLGITAEADLNLTKSVDDKTAEPGQTLTYTLVVTNTGDADATNVVVTDNLPDGFVFLAGGKTTRTWNIGTLAAGESKTLVYKVVVGNDVAAGEYVNRAFVTADFFDPIVAQATVTVKVPQVLGLATTGVGLMDYLTFALGLFLVVVGVIAFRQVRRRGQAQA